MLTATTGAVITLKRKTPTTNLLVGWTDGSVVDMDNLLTADRQNFYSVQEQEDASTLALANSVSALAQVADALDYDRIATVAAIPAAPVNGRRIEISDSTGIQSFSPLTGRPPGFVGATSLTVRLVYTTTGNAWQWVDYRAADPDSRYSRAAALGTIKSTASGTAIDFTDIPSWVKRISLMFNGVSQSSTQNFLVQLGVGTTPTTSGYTNGQTTLTTAASTTVATSSAGIPILHPQSTCVISGRLVIERFDPSANVWLATGLFASTAGAIGSIISAGTVSLSGALGMLRLTTAAGTAAFDLGSINVIYD